MGHSWDPDLVPNKNPVASTPYVVESPMVASASPAVLSARLVMPATPATLQIPAGPGVASVPEVANVEIKLTSDSNWACRKK